MQSYIDYVQNVLGVRSVLRTVTAAVDSTENAASLYFVFESELSVQEQDLFAKIIAALKLQSTDYQVLHSSAVPASAWSVVMSVNPSEAKKILSHLDSNKTLFTYSPKALLQDPQLKREVWENLKKFMAQR